MKRILILFVLISLCFLSSCNCVNNKSKVSFYDKDDKWNEYLDMFYTSINTEGSKYAAFDLRSKEVYETEHLRHFQNYDLNVGSKDEFFSYLTNNYSKKYIIYIYIETLDDLNYFDDLLDSYKNIYVYIGDYQTYRSLGDELFTFDSGPYDCNC
jgi:hypothetical protein